MIKCTGKETNFETFFTNGRHEGSCDVPAEKGGGDAGFRPHELLEAALACCLNISLWMYATRHNIPLAGLATEVSLDRRVAGEAVFEYGLELDGPITRAKGKSCSRLPNLAQLVKPCPEKFYSSMGPDKEEFLGYQRRLHGYL